MKKIGICLLCVLFIFSLAGCSYNKAPKIGVVISAGSASRWAHEMEYMERYSKTLGMEIEVRLNTNESEKPLADDCYELIDSGADVLIVRTRGTSSLKGAVDYAHERNVPVISYDTLIEGVPVDLFVGNDCKNTGELLGSYLAEMVTSGDYLLLWGDRNRNVDDMYDGAMKYLDPLKDNIHIISELSSPGWSTEEAKRLVKETVAFNGNHVDAIFAFNDSLAGAAAEALAELGITEPVVITGIDAELDAARRIVAGTQSCTAYVDTEAMAKTAIDQAFHLANGEKAEKNSEMDNYSGTPIPSYLLTRQLVTRLNLDRVLIESGHFTTGQVYGEAASK